MIGVRDSIVSTVERISRISYRVLAQLLGHCAHELRESRRTWKKKSQWVKYTLPFHSVDLHSFKLIELNRNTKYFKNRVKQHVLSIRPQTTETVDATYFTSFYLIAIKNCRNRNYKLVSLINFYNTNSNGNIKMKVKFVKRNFLNKLFKCLKTNTIFTFTAK